MRFLGVVMVFFCLAFVAGCTIQSTVILPDAAAAGDPITGFPSDTAFKLESFDRQQNAYHYMGTVTPQKAGDGRIRYVLAFNEDSKTLFLQAKKLSENNYVLRYGDKGDGVEPSVNESALVFVTVEDGTYYVLSSLADKALFEKAFPNAPRPTAAGDTIMLTSDAEAAQLSAYFRDHRSDFRVDQDYVRIRLAK
jgi:hypothetical protein